MFILKRVVGDTTDNQTSSQLAGNESEESVNNCAVGLRLNAVCTIGRKTDCTFVLKDLGVSRIHAKIALKKGGDESRVYLEDSSSFGTTVKRNGEQMKIQRDSCELFAGDIVQFGGKEAVKLLFNALIVSLSSNLDVDIKQQITNIVENHLGGSIKELITTETSHICCKSAFLSTKCLLGLVYGKHFVTPEFFKDALKWTMEPKLPQPVEKEYIPELEEEGIPLHLKTQLLPNDRRRSFFADRLFLFVGETTYMAHKEVIVASGGEAKMVNWNVDSVSSLISLLEEPSTILISIKKGDYSKLNSAAKKSVKLLFDKLKELGKRQVVESEIPYAIFGCSMKNYCNVFANKEALESSQTSQSQAVAFSQLSTNKTQGQEKRKASAPPAENDNKDVFSIFKVPAVKRPRKSSSQHKTNDSQSYNKTQPHSLNNGRAGKPEKRLLVRPPLIAQEVKESGWMRKSDICVSSQQDTDDGLDDYLRGLDLEKIRRSRVVEDDSILKTFDDTADQPNSLLMNDDRPVNHKRFTKAAQGRHFYRQVPALIGESNLTTHGSVTSASLFVESQN